MKTILKIIFKNLFGGVSWAVQNIIEYWKVFTVIAITGYLIWMNLRVRNLNSEVTKLTDTVFVQDSTIVAVRSKFMVDSVNMALRIIQTQNTLSQVNQENKTLKKEKEILKKENSDLKQLTNDMAAGLKCKKWSFFKKKIVDC
jgi:cell division protein FtsL